MVNQLKEKILQRVAEIEAVFAEYQQQREALSNNPDFTVEAKRQHAWDLYEKAKARAEDLSKHGFKEIAEVKELITRQLALAQMKADDEEAAPGKRAKVEALREQLEAELIAAGPFEYLKELSKLIEGNGNPLRLEAARAILPSLKTSLYAEMYSKETGGQVLNPWGDNEGVISPDNSQLVKAELQSLVRRLSDSLKPEVVKQHESDLIAVVEVEAEISGAFNRSTRLLNTVKPSGLQPGSPWGPEELEKQ